MLHLTFVSFSFFQFLLFCPPTQFCISALVIPMSRCIDYKIISMISHAVLAIVLHQHICESWSLHISLHIHCSLLHSQDCIYGFDENTDTRNGIRASPQSLEWYSIDSVQKFTSVERALSAGVEDTASLADPGLFFLSFCKALQACSSKYGLNALRPWDFWPPRWPCG